MSPKSIKLGSKAYRLKSSAERHWEDSLKAGTSNSLIVFVYKHHLGDIAKILTKVLGSRFKPVFSKKQSRRLIHFKSSG